ncbi:MAG: hypothetical protein B6D55_07815 [Candidatus Omnitrophica bacterium 4484_70.2]|nr:MAG: hypothetical protein B6D55_07815 [Candidatus Omnitrophica bacterium 4484_70.2]
MKNVFTINREDVQRIAMKKLGRKLTTEEIERVKKGVEFGLECWEEVVVYAIEEVMKENKG